MGSCVTQVGDLELRPAPGFLLYLGGEVVGGNAVWMEVARWQVLALTSLSDGLWCGTASQVNPSSPVLLFVRVFCHSNRKETRTLGIDPGRAPVYAKQ